MNMATAKLQEIQFGGCHILLLDDWCVEDYFHAGKGWVLDAFALTKIQTPAAAEHGIWLFWSLDVPVC